MLKDGSLLKAMPRDEEWERAAKNAAERKARQEAEWREWDAERTRNTCLALDAARALDEDTDRARAEGYGYSSLRILTNIARANAIRKLLEQQHYACGCAFTPRDRCIGHHGVES